MRQYYLILIGIGLFTLTGCVKDYPSKKCKVNGDVSLHFTYLGDGSEDIFDSKIETVEYFIYDEDGNLATRKKTKEKSEQINLSVGKYSIICFGNADQHTIIHTPQISRGSVSSDYYVTTATHLGLGMDSLYYAPKNESRLLQFTVVGGEKVSQEIEFISAHIKLECYVKGLKDVKKPEVKISNLPSEYNFKREMQGDIIDYISPMAKREKQGVVMDYAKFNIPRITNDNDDVFIYVLNSENGENIASVDFIKFIEDNNIDISLEQELIISILFEFNSLGVEVSVPDWSTIPIIPGN